MFSETPQNWTGIDVTLLWVLQQNPHLSGRNRENFKASVFIPIRTDEAEYRSVMLSFRGSLSQLHSSHAVCLLTQIMNQRTSPAPAVSYQRLDETKEPTMSPPSPLQALMVHSHHLHSAMLYQSSVLPCITVIHRRLRAS